MLNHRYQVLVEVYSDVDDFLDYAEERMREYWFEIKRTKDGIVGKRLAVIGETVGSEEEVSVKVVDRRKKLLEIVVIGRDVDPEKAYESFMYSYLIQLFPAVKRTLESKYRCWMSKH